MATVVENIKGNWSSNDFNRPPFLGTFSLADIATINAAIAAGTLSFLPPASSLVSDTGVSYTLSGIGTAAAFAVDGGGSSLPFAPGAPTIGTATAGNGTVTLPFTASASPGASAIIDHQALLVDGTTQTVSASPAVFTGKTNGTPYVGAVRSRNTQGYGPWSAQSNSVTPIALQLKQVALACRTPVYLLESQGGGATAVQTMSETFYVSTSDMATVAVEYANFAWNQNEIVVGAAVSIESRIVYGGVYTPLPKGGAAVWTQTDGGIDRTDEITLPTIIPAGASYSIREYRTTSVAGKLPCLTLRSFGAKMAFGVTTANLVAGGTITNTSSAGYGPSRILSRASVRSVGLVGDSRQAGQGDTADASLNIGEVARSLGSNFAYISAGTPSDRLVKFLQSPTKRLALTQDCEIIISNYGINDFVAGTTGAQHLANVKALKALYPGKTFYQCTIPTKTTSANTGIDAVSNPARVAFNDLLRADGTVNYFELADALENGRNGGLWGSTSWQSDDLHESAAGYARIVAAGVINPALL